MKGYVYKALLVTLCLSVSAMSWADLKQGIRYWKAGDYKKGIPELLPYAKAGNTKAQLYLSMFLLFKGGKTFKDINDAKHWMLASANGGNPYAMWKLGDDTFCPFYFGITCDTKKWQAKAITRWKQLAKQGNGDAVAMLAEFDAGITQYIPGLNSYEYKKQMKKAAEMGSGYAAMKYADGNDFSKISDKEKKTITTFLIDSANKGYAPAMYYLSVVPQLVGAKQSFDWLKKCANIGYSKCVNDLYSDYRDGTNTQKNLFQAYVWGLIGNSFNMNTMIPLIDGDKFTSLTSVQKAQAKKEADAFVKTHLPDFGDVNPMNP